MTVLLVAVVGLALFGVGVWVGVKAERQANDIDVAMVSYRANAEAMAEVNSWAPELEPVGESTPATLPDDAVDRDQLRYMEVGDSAWTLPWAMSISQDGSAWLNANYPAEQAQSRNAIGQMNLTMRVERREDGYYVRIPPGEKYDRMHEGRPHGTWGEIPVAGWIG